MSLKSATRVVFYLCLLGVMAQLGIADAHSADELERNLVRVAPELLQTFRSRGYRNVGVLKFRVQRGSDSATDRAGGLNMRLADKLELALILANKVKDPVGIVTRASRIAATISRISPRIFKA